jgi:hypothetical protein
LGPGDLKGRNGSLFPHQAEISKENPKHLCHWRINVIHGQEATQSVKEQEHKETAKGLLDPVVFGGSISPLLTLATSLFVSHYLHAFVFQV